MIRRQPSRQSARSDNGRSERLAFGSTPKSVTRVGRGNPEPRMSEPVDEPLSRRPAAASRRAPRTQDEWAFTWTLLFTAALFLRPQDLIPPLQVLHLAEVTAIAGLASLFSSRLRAGQSLTRMTPELAVVIALGAVILVTAPLSIWMGGAIHVFVDTYVKVILVYLLAVNVISSPKRVERLTWVLVLAVGYIAFRAVLDYVRGTNLVAAGTRVEGEVGGVLQNPNDLALNMVSFLPLAAFMVLRPGSVFRRGLVALCALFMVGAIVASGSRGGFLGFVAMAAVLAVFAAKRRPAFVLAGILAALCALPVLPHSYFRRLASITNSKLDDYGSEDARRELLKESFQAFAQNPLFGVGAGQFVNWKPDERVQAAHEAHNVFLQVAADLGLPGLLLFLFLVVRAFTAVYGTRRLLYGSRFARPGPRRGRAKPTSGPLTDAEWQLLDAHSAAMMAALVGWLVCACFASVAYSWTFYYLLALAATPREMLRDLVPEPRGVPVRPGLVAEVSRA